MTAAEGDRQVFETKALQLKVILLLDNQQQLLEVQLVRQPF